MAKEQSNAGTTNDRPNSCVDCKITATRRVSYTFKTGLWPSPKSSETSLRIPVAVAIDGKVLDEFKTKAGVFNAKQRYDYWVEPGQKVSLYLNSDADPLYREFPVFEVTANERDIQVIVSEKRGKLGEKDSPKLVATRESTEPGKRKYDEYEATLTGDTWKKVSHKYTAAEALKLVPAGTHAAVQTAVMSIYKETLQGDMVVNLPDAAQPLTITFEVAENPRDNVTDFDLYRDGLPRVHPQAWFAVIEAAQAADVHQVNTTSAWRPMLGSIAHRTGLALDVGQIDKKRLNRENLEGTGRDFGNVSEEERKLFKEKEVADTEATAAEAALKKEQAAMKKFQAEQLKAAEKDTEAAEKLAKTLKAATDKNKDAQEKRSDANKAWNDERNKNEPSAVKAFRKSLLSCKCVSQVFDPWLMDGNTQDKVEPVPNLQTTGNEKLHNNHLHVTVFNPRVPS